MDIEEVKKMRDMFERGEIRQEDMDIETQKAIIQLCRSEIEEIREEITSIRKERNMYKNILNDIEDVQGILGSLTDSNE